MLFFIMFAKNKYTKMMKNSTVEKKIKQHNTITSGRYDFSACQLDILFMLLSQLNENDPVIHKYNIRVKDIEMITGRTWNYQQLKDSNADMMSRVFEVITERNTLKQLVLFSSVEYVDGTGSFDMKINDDARPYFFDLKNSFTLLELKSVLSCSSKHAKRIYSLACQWRTAGGHTYSISDLKEILGLKDPKGKEPEQYAEISAFQKYVLSVAKKQINEKTDIYFDYELLKIKSRSFTHIKLLCGFSKPSFGQLEIDFQYSPEDLRKIASIQAYGISKDMAEKIAKKCYKQFVEVKNDTIEAMKKGKEIIDTPKYIIGVLQKKGLIEKKIK